MAWHTRVFKYLHTKKDKWIEGYNVKELKNLLVCNEVYLLELSDTMSKKDNEGNVYINVNDLF